MEGFCFLSQEYPVPAARSRTLDQLRSAILSGLWRPGERLQPAALAEQFGTSSTVVREALTRLAGDDLVIVRPNRGFFVMDLDLRQFADLTELRCVTEGLAAKLSLERGDLKWESELMAAHHRLERTARRQPDDPQQLRDEWGPVHRAFHTKLLEACGCPPMIRLATNLSDSTELYRRWSAGEPAALRRNVEKEHREILHAALSRDASRLTALLRAHYEATARIVIGSGLVPELESGGRNTASGRAEST